MNIRRQARQMMLVYLLLLLLLGIGIGGSYLPLGYLQSVICLLAAFIQAVLVIVFLMEVRLSPQLIWVLSGGAFLWLAILGSLVYADYLTRNGRF
ncbi:MAG: Caa(3)-type oxidase subunit IV [Verrucomicrobia bacterium]|nr:Caa(3)-type oxidase subunit IV [Verrucomicrobiota bacterium]